MPEIVIVGGGGFGREVYDWATDFLCARPQNGSEGAWSVKGFLDDDPQCLDGFDMGVPLLGAVGNHAVKRDERFILAVGTVDAKRAIVAKLRPRGARFLTFVHPTAAVSPFARLGEGAVLCPFATVSSHATVGDFVTLNCYAFVAHDAKVGNYTVFSPYATVNGFAELAEDVFLGTQTTVIFARRVGRGAKISAGSVAMRDVPGGALVQGVPGKHYLIYGKS